MIETQQQRDQWLAEHAEARATRAANYHESCNTQPNVLSKVAPPKVTQPKAPKPKASGAVTAQLRWRGKNKESYNRYMKMYRRDARAKAKGLQA